MRTKTVSYKVYKFSELSDKAKEKAKYDHFAACPPGFESEAFASLEKLAKHFGGKLTDYEIDYDGGYSPSLAAFDMPEDWTREDIAAKLKDLGGYNPTTLKGLGDCKLTGVCFDEWAIDGFRWEFFNGGIRRHDASRV